MTFKLPDDYDTNRKKQRSPRYRTAFGAPGRMCRCGHREGSHNELARCCAGECLCGNGALGSGVDVGGFDPIEISPNVPAAMQPEVRK